MSQIKTGDIASLLREEGATCVLQYGSSLHSPDTANDIDLVALYPEDAPPHTELGRFDIIRLSKDRFEYYRRSRNPVYCTEPCLTGEVIAGDESIILEAVEQLRSSPPPQQAINHNINRSLQAFSDSVEALKAGSPAYTVHRLQFVASYWLFATWYHENNPARPLETVREATDNVGIVDEIFDMVEHRREHGSVDADTVADTVKQWQTFLLTSKFDCREQTR